ncbi:MAG TPA: response regulator [Candidatus Altiarchaeales archaeon]|nr:response regulator [Candidatus Altiarchaeales archaeon]
MNDERDSVLIVDDDPITRDGLTNVLRKGGYRVASVGSSREAI